VCIVGEAPGEQEVEIGRPFVGPSGQLLDRLIVAGGGDPQKTYRTNVVLCRPPGNREPSSEEISCCRPRLEAEVNAVQSSLVVAAGKAARLALLGPDAQNGQFYEVERFPGKQIMPMWHPAYVLRKPSAFESMKRDLFKALNPIAPMWDKAGSRLRGSGQLPEVETVVIETEEQLMAFNVNLKPGTRLAFDLETNQVNFRSDMILCIAFALEEDRAYVVTDELIYDSEVARATLRALFSRTDIEFTAHNGKYDLKFLWAQVFDGDWSIGRVDFDTMLAHYALVEVFPHDLKTLLSWYFGYPDYEGELVGRHLRNRSDEYSKVPPGDLYRYASIDVCGDLRLAGRLEQDLRASGLLDTPFRDIFIPASAALTRLEYRGVAVDAEYLGRLSDEMGRVAEQLVERMREYSGLETLNPSSWEQIGNYIWGTLGLPQNSQSRTNKTRRRQGKDTSSTSSDSVEHLASINVRNRRKVRDGHPFIDLLMEYRRVAKLKSTYVDNLLDASRAAVDGRVHATANIHGTEVGRLSFTDPALQTIPRPDEYWGAATRSGICAGEGKMLGILDYNQAEFRVFAALCGDPYLLEAYRNNRNIHSEVARGMYGENFSKAERVLAKMWDFAWIYGGTEHSFAQDAGMPLDEAQAWVRKFNALMPVAVEWKRSQFQVARTKGYVTTRTGRRRRFPLITRENLDEIRKSSVHQPIAGGAADITLLSLIEAEMRREIPCVLTIHDSIIIEAPEDEIEARTEEVLAIMMETATKWYPEVAWKVDPEIRRVWCEPLSSSQKEAELIGLLAASRSSRSPESPAAS
jgi:uracil-DNA glycosylase family 4